MTLKRTLLIICLLIAPLYGKTTVELVEEAIRAQNAQWVTGTSWVSALSETEFAELCGTILEAPPDASERLLTLTSSESLPARLDWRNNSGNWMTPVRNQGGCGSCWDFSAIAQVEAWRQIYANTPNSGIDLSEQFVLSCGNAGSCEGGLVERALSFIQENGVPPEKCFPYQANDKLPCSDACADRQSQAVTIPGWGYVTLNEILIDHIKEAVYRHPVSASYTVFQDFQLYGGGVYEHVWGDAVGGHAVLIVGWDDEGQYWICKNSWGANWGENGYFRIKWGDSGMGTHVPFIYNSPARDAVSFSVDSLNLTLTAGEERQVALTLTNKSAGALEYALFDSEVPRVFHVSTFNAYDDFSWWCANPAVGGYADHWLQFLDTPIIDLSAAAEPQLQFMVFWAIETPEGAFAPWDGWDGANVWISTDGGGTFQVMQPIAPAYTCESLWAFGEPEQGWNLGTGIPGWAGNSKGWQRATFDLRPYRSAQTVIRFAFASDMGFSTLDDASMWGLFLDRIEISDGAAVLFSDEGNDQTTLKRTGFGDSPAQWITLGAGIGVLPPGAGKEIALQISAKELCAGDYAGALKVASNDAGAADLQLPIRLTVTPPTVDAAIFARRTVAERLYVGSTLTPAALVRNLGLSPVNQASVLCEIRQGDDIVFAESLTLRCIESQEYLRIDFAEWTLPDTGFFEIDFRLAPITDDVNAENDASSFTIYCTALVDDFELGADAWEMAGGWGVTNLYGSRSGKFAAHCNNGVLPHRPNMNAVMTLKESLAIHKVDSVNISYWASAHVEIGKDMCLLEISTDSRLWTAVDTVSNQNIRYEQRVVELTRFLRPEHTHLWLRFRFISNESDESVGVFIDDVHFYGRPKNIAAAVATSAQPSPQMIALHHNYPNPFNGATRIAYTLSAPAWVEVSVVNLSGRKVGTLIQEPQSAGLHEVVWNPVDQASGIYFYKITAASDGAVFETMKKMLLIK